MLTVTIGVSGRTGPLHVLQIINDETGTEEVGHYLCRLGDAEAHITHRRSDGALALAAKAIGALLPGSPASAEREAPRSGVRPSAEQTPTQGSTSEERRGSG